LSRALTQSLPIKPPKELLQFFEDPPLVGDEKAEDYMRVFAAIVTAVKPADAVDWLYCRDIVDLSWEIRRERAIKVSIIELSLKEIVVDLIKTTHGDPASLEPHIYRIFQAKGDARRWSVDAKSRNEICATLTARGYPLSELLAQAYIKRAVEIDAVDRRIASYETRKVGILREVERRVSARLARQLNKASTDVIDAEFSEAAE
jgi:hypothetical protein